MEFLKAKMLHVGTVVLAILMFNFSILLAEIDAMQRFKPNKQLVEFFLTLADLQDFEEDQAPAAEIDLYFQNKAEHPVSLPYLSVKKQRIEIPAVLIYHPQETVTPPPEV